MKKDQEISQILRQLHVPASSKLDERIHEEITEAGGPALTGPPSPELTFGQMIALLLKQKSTRYTLATTLGLVLLVVLVLNHSTTMAFAMDQAVEALKRYKALHLTGYYTPASGKTIPIDAWERSDATGNRVEIALITVGDVTEWITGNKTYDYDRAEKKATIEPGINFDAWVGPKLLADMARLKDYQAVEGDDPATGQKRVVVTCSLDGFAGPESFLMEFDARTRLLVSAKSWLNLTREGTPQCSIEKILYFEDLPDGDFSFQPPADTQFTNAPLEVPGANLLPLSDPTRGISTGGMTQEQACQKILDQLWSAAIKGDFNRIRQLCPVTAMWSDAMLRGSGDPDETAVQLLKIGSIEQTGSSKLGPLALVPVRIRYQDGSVRENWMVVQFRETDQETSCVVVGPRGYELNAKE